MIDKLRKGQVTIFGKSISVLAAILTLVALSGIGLALLTTYITITGTATVGQSVMMSAIESTWKYNAKAYTPFPSGATSASLDPISVVGGDEQDVGILISNNAPVSADIKIQKTVTGPSDPLYTMCSDDTVEIYTGYTPSNDATCTGYGTVETCSADTTCVWTGSTCKGNEQCKSDPLTVTCDSDVTSSDTITLSPVTTTWYCVRNIWDPAAVPGSYGFTISIVPA